MNSPLVSICVPCYNVEAYIGRFLESLRIQTYKNLEIILVDDGSTDGTHKKIDDYLPRLKAEGYRVVYIRKENGGQSSAINVALKHVHGEFLTWPDPDDWLTADSIEKRVHFLQAHPDVGIVRGNVSCYSEETMLPVGCFEPQELSERCVPDFFEKLLFANIGFAPICTMIRFSYWLEANNGTDIYVSKPAGQNWQMLLPIAARHECWQMPEILGYYLIRKQSHSRAATSAREKYQYQMMCEDVIVNTLNRITNAPVEKTLSTIVLHYSRIRFQISLDGGLFKHALCEYKKIAKNHPSTRELLKKAFLLFIVLPIKKLIHSLTSIR